MGVLGGPDSYYAGHECYKFTERLIQNGKEILIVSPYIDAYYAKFLIEKSGSRRIRVISSSMDPKAKKILEKKRPVGMLLSILVIILSLDYLSYASRLYFSLFAVPSILLIILSLLLFKSRRYSIEVKTPAEFVHAKMYISENEAIHGSANLTYNGMHKNLEHIEVVREKEKVARLRDEFFRLWK
jgi:phosphatidylserine/phosphatidylglycerophosphate/cardiolipin synthase-like enzyme